MLQLGHVPPHPYTSRRRSEAECSCFVSYTTTCNICCCCCCCCWPAQTASPTEARTHSGLRQPIYPGTRTLWTRRLSARKTHIHPANRLSQYALCPLKPCRCVDLSLQHRLSRTIAYIVTTLPHNDSSGTTHAHCETLRARPLA
jgi:hypothetical protein